MFLRFLKSLLVWLSDINLKKLFWLTVIVSATTAGWTLVSKLIKADGNITYCYTSVNSAHTFPVYNIMGHRDWKSDEVLATSLSQEYVIDLAKTLPICQK
jgi:hypothetical protein